MLGPLREPKLDIIGFGTAAYQSSSVRTLTMISHIGCLPLMYEVPSVAPVQLAGKLLVTVYR